VHFLQPGFLYIETIKSGSLSAALGGYTAVCTMPNLNPVPDSYNNLKPQLDAIESDACVNVYPYGAITEGENGKSLASFDELSDYVVGFSDDGKGVQEADLMLSAMKKATGLNKIIVAHCEVNSLLNGGYIHQGEYARKNNHSGISSASEYEMIKRDIELVEKTGCKYHVCHISTKESVEIIRKAKAKGLDVTCETAPHYLVLCDEDLQEDGKFKMNPPLRGREDREALIEGISDGTIDIIATDHAPHSFEEKSRGLEKSAFGIVGLETAFPILHTKLVKPGIASMEKLIQLLSTNPRKRFNIPLGNDFSLWDLSICETVDPQKFLSMGKSTPFEGETVYGKCLLTVCNGKIVYNEK
jgi:dihydroorotase